MGGSLSPTKSIYVRHGGVLLESQKRGRFSFKVDLIPELLTIKLNACWRLADGHSAGFGALSVTKQSISCRE